MKPSLYCLGFCFDADRHNVVLIRKLRPPRHRGLLNGVGGKVNDNERPVHAMKREFLEETGVLVEEWDPFGLITARDGMIMIFKSFTDDMRRAETKTDEAVVLMHVTEVAASPPSLFVTHVPGIIQMALNGQTAFRKSPISII